MVESDDIESQKTAVVSALADLVEFRCMEFRDGVVCGCTDLGVSAMMLFVDQGGIEREKFQFAITNIHAEHIRTNIFFWKA